MWHSIICFISFMMADINKICPNVCIYIVYCMWHSIICSISFMMADINKICPNVCIMYIVCGILIFVSCSILFTMANINKICQMYVFTITYIVYCMWNSVSYSLLYSRRLISIRNCIIYTIYYVASNICELFYFIQDELAGNGP